MLEIANLGMFNGAKFKTRAYSAPPRPPAAKLATPAQFNQMIANSLEFSEDLFFFTLMPEAKVVVSLNIDDFTSGLQASCSVTVFMASVYIIVVF